MTHTHLKPPYPVDRAYGWQITPSVGDGQRHVTFLISKPPVHPILGTMNLLISRTLGYIKCQSKHEQLPPKYRDHSRDLFLNFGAPVLSLKLAKLDSSI